MIDPNGIPQYDGDPVEIISQALAMTAGADAFARTGQDVHASWQGLAGVYSAPESAELLGATQPVAVRSLVTADEVSGVSNALVSFAETMAPIKARLQQLKAEASAFVASVSGDDDWTDDGDKVDKNNAMLSEVGHLVAEWQAAERDCANAINRTYGSDFRYVADNGDDTTDIHEYGYTSGTYDDALQHDGKLPWGTSETEDPGIIGNVTGFFHGVFVDGLWGDIKGLGALVGLNGGWTGMKQAWSGMFVLASLLTPQGQLYGMADPQFGARQRELLSALGGSMIAKDMWSQNPGRALGQVTWNFGSLLLGGEGAIGKAGKVGRLGALAERAGSISVRSLFDSAIGGSRAGDLAARIATHLDDLRTSLRVPERVDIDVPERVDVAERAHVDVPDPAHIDAPQGLATAGPERVHAEPPLHADGPAAPASGHEGTPGGHSPGTEGPPGSGHGPTTPPHASLRPAHQSWEGQPSYSSDVRTVDQHNPALDVPELNSNNRGKLGEELTRLDVQRQGYVIVAERMKVRTPQGDFIPDFIVKDPQTGHVMAVESKFGPGAHFTDNQLTGYRHLAEHNPIRMVSRRGRLQLRRHDVLSVDDVVVYRWNTRIVPDRDLLAEAWDSLWPDGVP